MHNEIIIGQLGFETFKYNISIFQVIKILFYMPFEEAIIGKTVTHLVLFIHILIE